MKKLLLSLILFTSLSSAYSQNFVYTAEQHVVENVQAENYSRHEMRITTPNPEAIQFKWELVSNTFPEGWSYSLCDQGGCYVGIPPSGTMSAITLEEAQNGKDGFFILNLTASYYYGRGKVELYIYDSNDYSKGDTLSFDLNWPTPTSIFTNGTIDNIEMFPNPATNLVQLSNISNNVTKVNVLDIFGKVVYEQTVSSNELDIAVHNLERGIYFIAFQTKDGTSSTKKLVLK